MIRLDMSDVVSNLIRNAQSPIGKFTCPVSLPLKLLFKEICAENIDWDVEYVNSRDNKFRKWLNNLHDV